MSTETITDGDRAAIAEWASAIDLDELLGDGDAGQARATVEAWQAIERADERRRVIRESLSVALEDSIPADLDCDQELRALAIEAVQERLLEVLGR